MLVLIKNWIGEYRDFQKGVICASYPKINKLRYNLQSN